MKWVLLALGIVVLLVIVVVAWGMSLPRTHRATSEIRLRNSPEEVWAIVRDPAALLGTWPDLKSVRRLEDQAGREIWEEEVGGFPMRLIVSEAVPPSRLVTTIDADPEAAFGGRWVHELEPANGGTRVRVTEDGWIGNPVFRVMANVMGLHRSIDGYLRALGSRLGQEVTPVHLTAP